MISQNCHQWLSVESNNHRYIFGTKLGKLSHPAALYFQFRMTVLTSVLPDKVILFCMVATYMYMYGSRFIKLVIFCDNLLLLETWKAFEILKSSEMARTFAIKFKLLSFVCKFNIIITFNTCRDFETPQRTIPSSLLWLLI